MASKKYSRGGSPLPIVFLVLTVGILLAGGYFVYTTVNKGSGMTLPNPLSKVTDLAGGAMLPKVTENDFKDISDPLIRKHFAAQANVRSFRTTSNSSGRGTESMTEIVMTSQTDFRMHTKMEATEMITIGDTTYLKDPKDGKWWMEKAKPEPTGTQVKNEPIPTPEDFKAEYEKKSTMTYKSLGTEACGTLTCYKYEETDSSNSDSGKRTFWFDNKQLLLRKEVSGYGEFTATTEYSYDNIAINVPSPTKPVPEGKSIYEMMAFGESGVPAGMMPTNDQLNQVKQLVPKNVQDMQDYSPPADYSQPTDEPVDNSGDNGSGY